jgi:hypothetical protein
MGQSFKRRGMVVVVDENIHMACGMGRGDERSSPHGMGPDAGRSRTQAIPQWWTMHRTMCIGKRHEKEQRNKR